MLEYWLSGTLHIRQNSLAEVPTEKLINWSLGVIEKSSVKILSSNAVSISLKAYNLVIILK
jgi:hypothetical protein